MFVFDSLLMHKKPGFLGGFLLQTKARASVLVCEHERVWSYMCTLQKEETAHVKEGESVYFYVHVHIFALGKFSS